MPWIEPGAAGGEARMLSIELFLIFLASSTLICSWAHLADKMQSRSLSTWTRAAVGPARRKRVARRRCKKHHKARGSNWSSTASKDLGCWCIKKKGKGQRNTTILRHQEGPNRHLSHYLTKKNLKIQLDRTSCFYFKMDGTQNRLGRQFGRFKVIRN